MLAAIQTDDRIAERFQNKSFLFFRKRKARRSCRRFSEHNASLTDASRDFLIRYLL